MNYGEPWGTTADAAFNTMLAGTTDEIDPVTGKPRVRPQNTATTAPATVPAATPAATTAPINAAPAIGSAVQTISKESGPDLKYTSMGASLGSMIGPWGTAIGAVGGLIADVVSSDTANKAEARTRMDNYKEAQKTWSASADPALAGGYNQMTPGQKPWYINAPQNYANGGQMAQAHVVPGAQQAGAQVLADAAKTAPMTVPGTGSPTADGAKLPGASGAPPAVSPGEAVVSEGQFQDMGLAAGAGRDQLQEMLYPLSAMDPMGLYAQGGPASTLSSYIPNYSSHIDPSKNYVETAEQQSKSKVEEPKKDYLDTLIGSTLTTNLIGGSAALLHNATSKRTPLPVAKAATPALPNLNTGALNAKLDSDRARALATAVHNTRGTQSVGRDLGIVANDQQARTTNTMAVEQVQNQESLAQAQVLNQFALYNNQQSNQMRAQNAMLEQQHRLMKGDAITKSLAGLSQSTSNALNAKMSDMERATRDETMKRYVDYVRGTSSVSPYA